MSVSKFERPDYFHPTCLWKNYGFKSAKRSPVEAAEMKFVNTHVYKYAYFVVPENRRMLYNMPTLRVPRGGDEHLKAVVKLVSSF